MAITTLPGAQRAKRRDMPDPITRHPDHQVVEIPEWKHTDQIIGGAYDPYPGGKPPPFQTAEEMQDWLARRSAAEMRQLVPIAVAPECRVKLPSGRIALAGEEVGAHELHGDDLQTLVDRRVLIRVQGDNLIRFSRSADWRYRVADGKALMIAGKIVASGGEINETADLSGDRIRELISQGLIVENTVTK